jgi:hypothetical protein
MANYKKSFNFRNGVQVDEDNFVVNANGLVGIGTTIPESYLLNVYGDTRVIGLVTATSAKIGDLNVTGVSTVGFLTASNINASGVVTATTFYGDAAGLTNIYAIAVDGWYVSAGTISTTSSVGVATTNPTGTLQVGVAVTINNNGNATYTGIITAASFAGIGSDITQINASNISSGTLSNPRLPQSISVSGIVTAASFDGIGSNITQINASNISSGTLSNPRLPQNINVSGIVTAYSFAGFGTDISGINASNISSGTLSNPRLPQSISVSGIVTAAGGFVGNVTGTASTAQSLTGTPSITVGNITAANLNASGIITATTLGVSGLTTTTNLVAQTSIGIGTTNPIGDLQIRNATAASILVTSDTQSALISIGRSNSLQTSNGVLRFGNTNVSQEYSTQSSLDIINYALGNVNNYLNLGSSGVGTGAFNWIYGQNANTPLMTLTYGGSLGIGITIPSNTLHVVGTSTVTGNSYVSGDLFVSGSVDIGSNLTANNFNANTLTGSLVGSLTGNVNATTGISTFNQIQVNSAVGFTTVTISSNVGIQTSPSATYPLIVNANSGAFIVDILGGIGVGTNVFTYAPALAYSVSVDAARGVGYFQGVGVGTTTPSSFADFSAAGYNVPNLGSIFQFMIPPKVTTTQRNLLSIVEGGLIYNVTNKRLEVYNGIGWCGIATIP